MKTRLPLVFFSLLLFQMFCSDFGKVSAENTASDTLSWTWEVSSTTSTRTKTCAFEFSDKLLVNWGDGVSELIPDSLSSQVITHTYTAQANYSCSAIGVGISYFKADSRRLLNLDVAKVPSLTYLSCTSNQISSLDLTNNPLLVSLYFGSNSIRQLNLSRNLSLQTLTCSDNQLSQLNVSMLSALKKVTCHTNPLVKISICPTGELSYLSCTGCSLSVENLDSIFLSLPTLSAVSTSKNLLVLNNPGSSSCRSEIAAAKNWFVDRVATQSIIYMPSVSCKATDSLQVGICLKNANPVIAFELDVQIPDGFELDTVRSCLNALRKGQHVLSIARTSVTAKIYKIMAYSLKSKDSFSGTDGSLLQLFLKAPAEIKTYAFDLQKAILLDTLTNAMDHSIVDGQMLVGAKIMMGDANGDASVDVTDIVNLVAFINGRHPAGINAAAIDIDGNGLWNIVDVAKLVVIINAAGTPIRSASSSGKALDLGALSIYRADEAPSGNHLFVRQSADYTDCLELCLDNTDEILAFQTDLILPDGWSLQEDQLAPSSDRHSGQELSICKVSENRYRLLSYDLKGDVAYSGKTGVLYRLQLNATSGISDGAYPICLKQAVLTGLDLKSVASKAYDAVLNVENKHITESPLLIWVDTESRLWVTGKDLLEVTVWDVSGKFILQNKVKNAAYQSAPMKKGVYIVKATGSGVPDNLQKVAVK